MTEMASAAWLVGGELRLLMEKERVVLGLRVDVARLEAVTDELAIEPEHWTPLLTFYIRWAVTVE